LSIKKFFPIKKNGKLCCPKCKVELEWNRPKSYLDDYGRGSRGHIVKCPKCGFEYYEAWEFRD